MVVKNKFFVYPQISYSSNFNDEGTNMVSKTYWGQVSLQLVPKKIKFKSVKDSVNVYDAYSEILSDRLKRLNTALKDYDFEVDLYGQKESFSKEYVLTSKHCQTRIKGYERAMKPQELNVIYNIPGNEFSFARKEDVKFSLKAIRDLIKRSMAVEDFINMYDYYYTNVSDTKILIKIIKFRFKNKILRWIGK